VQRGEGLVLFLDDDAHAKFPTYRLNALPHKRNIDCREVSLHRISPENESNVVQSNAFLANLIPANLILSRLHLHFL
jgi:hypothetical protein